MNVEYLTVAEAATHVRRHPVTVRKALEAGELCGFQRKAHGRWTVRPACLDAWVEGRPCEHKISDANVRPLRRRAV